MSLPKNVQPKFTCKLPSDDRDVSFRPFLVKEEKALLIASQANDPESMIRAIKDTVAACVDDCDINKLPYFDIEYLFLMMRAKSVGEEIKFSYSHKGGVNREGLACVAKTEVTINIDDVKVKQFPEHQRRFMIDDKFGVQMRYPTIDMINKLSSRETNEVQLMASCIEFVYDQENTYPPENLQESVDYIEGMNVQQFDRFSKFFDTMPRLAHEVQYKCSKCGQVDTVKFEGVADFF